MSVKNVSVLGAGTMGHGIAQVFAHHGHAVTLIDIDETRLKAGRDGIEKSLGRMAKKEIVTADQISEIMGRISLSTGIDAASTSDLAVEAVSERLETKLEVFRQLDGVVPDGGLLASNTSSISITKIAAVTKRPDKVIGMHFMNPVPVMKLVEVIRGLDTSDETFQTVMRDLEGSRKDPG